jgi:hypothetical protein
MGIEVRGVYVQFRHLLKTRANRFEAFLKIFENLAGLGFDVAFAHHIPAYIHRGLARDVDVISHLHNLGEPGTRIPNPFGLYDFSRHISSLRIQDKKRE